jgi:hypothetical protein
MGADAVGGLPEGAIRAPRPHAEAWCMISFRSSLVVRRAATIALAAGVVLLSAGPAAAATNPNTGKVTPFVDCIWFDRDGTYTASLGYTSTASTTLTVPVGTDNFVAPSPMNRGQNTVFLTGTHHNVWVGTDNQEANWTILGRSIDLSHNVNFCSSKPVPVFGSALALLAGFALLTGAGSAALALGRRRRTGKWTSPATVAAD